MPQEASVFPNTTCWSTVCSLSIPCTWVSEGLLCLPPSPWGALRGVKEALRTRFSAHSRAPLLPFSKSSQSQSQLHSFQHLKVYFSSPFLYHHLSSSCYAYFSNCLVLLEFIPYTAVRLTVLKMLFPSHHFPVKNSDWVFNSLSD